MLVYTGIRRNAHDVLEEQLDRTRQGLLAEDLRLVGALVDQGLEVLTDGGAITRFGELLDAAWRAKQRLSSQVTNARIDAIYERARTAGAIGGKLVGAGAGGFLLLFAPPACREEVVRALPELHSVPFDFDHEGSRLLFYHP
jgi:D-glycero-alpha-D-manno-heptose-7-phosphate kinase